MYSSQSSEIDQGGGSMLRLLYFEIRKNYLKKFVVASFLVFVVIDILSIYDNYINGDYGPFAYFLGHTEENRASLEFYTRMHNKLDGALTKEKADFVAGEDARLESITKDGAYSREYQPDSYTGYLWGDYVSFHTYFFKPMKYMALYAANNRALVEKAVDNIAFYKKYGNNFEASKNEFIVRHYANRNITYFFETRHWEKLLDYELSNFLIFLLMILGLAPIFVNEKETNMHALIVSNTCGRIDLSYIKALSSFIYIAFLVLVFSCINLFTFGLLYGFGGLNLPLYAIEEYQFTPFNGSVLSFYLTIVLLKLIGATSFGMMILLASSLSGRVIFPFVLSMLMFFSGMFLSGYMQSVVFSEIILAIISPFTLLKNNRIFMQLSGMNIGGRFFLISNVCALVQGIISVVLFLVIRKRAARNTCVRSKVL